MNNFNSIYNKTPKEIYFPNSKNENWRYINLNSLKEKIDKGVQINKPLVVSKNQNLDSHILINQLIIINITKEADPAVTLNLDVEVSRNIDLKPRFLVYSEKNTSSNIQIINRNNEAIINSVFEFYLAENSKLNFIALNNSKKSVEILNYWFEINKDANLKATFVSLGDKQTLKNDIRVDLVG